MALSVRAAFFSLAFFSFLRLLISVLALEAKRFAMAASLMLIEAVGVWHGAEDGPALDSAVCSLLMGEDGSLSGFLTFVDLLPSK